MCCWVLILFLGLILNPWILVDALNLTSGEGGIAPQTDAYLQPQSNTNVDVIIGGVEAKNATYNDAAATQNSSGRGSGGHSGSGSGGGGGGNGKSNGNGSGSGGGG
ncbi:hypothetical protein FRX31_017642 [Thalictrum thalictroides]|uniref:Uncharacterized protein n=1 Tax=Thalictrum thalictroides TaxID=46969 RepID=A0A7J6W6D3_THATH|nr:hypothetical protein FRX31_017642 [Thalictrum thalictroides]